VRRGALGIAGETIYADNGSSRPEPRGGAVRFAGLQSDRPGAAAGLRQGDVILTLEDQPVAGIDDLYRLLSADRIDVACRIELLRDSRRLGLEVIPCERR
jgi:S1-C subfamily serine protease